MAEVFDPSCLSSDPDKATRYFPHTPTRFADEATCSRSHDLLDLADLAAAITQDNGSNLDVCRTAVRQGLVEEGVEGSDLVAGNRGRVWAEKGSGERSFCDGDLVGCHRWLV